MAETLIHNIKFENNSIYANVGKNGDLSCDIICRSENNKFFFGSGLYYATINSEPAECIYLFTETEMLYRKKFEEDAIDYAAIADDGAVFFYSDAYDLISIHPNGKQNFKKHLGIYPDHIKLSAEYLHLLGNDEDGDGDIVFLFYNFLKKKPQRIRIPDINYIDEDGEEDSLSIDSSALFPLDRGYILFYEDHQTCVMYDFEGNKLEPSFDERQQALALLKEKEEAERLDRERKRTEREAYLKERQEFSDLLLKKFGANKKGAIKYVIKEKNVSKQQAETIVDHIYSKYTSEQIYDFRKQNSADKEKSGGALFNIFMLACGFFLFISGLLMLLVDPAFGFVFTLLGAAFFIYGFKNVRKRKR